MPHLVILYTNNLERETDISALCRQLADTMLSVRDESGRPVFPPGGTRVLAYPTAHHAVGDGGAAGRAAGTHDRGGAGDAGDYAFMYLNLRMAQGRSAAVQKDAGERLMAAVRQHFGALFEQRRIGITLQIDEGREVFDAKHSNLHPLFNR